MTAPLNTRLHVLILQHPQEPDKELGTARMAHARLPNSTLKVGLSWPNLKGALGKEAVAGRWAVLYLGSGVKGEKFVPTSPVVFVNKKGEPTAAPKEPTGELDGVVILDGTWSQAKTLWWRNAWLLKLKRVVLLPKQKSLYGNLRREPRRECLSTIESIAEVLTGLGEPQTTGDSLKSEFTTFLEKHRAELSKAPSEK
jgi:DTW domain-containing protein